MRAGRGGNTGTANQQARQAAALLAAQERARAALSRQAAKANERDIREQQRAAERLALMAAKANERDLREKQRATERLAVMAAKANERDLTEQERAKARLNAQAARANERELTRKERMLKKHLTDEEIQIAVHNKKVDMMNQKRTQTAMKASGIEQQTWAQSVKQAVGLESALTKVGIAMIGLSAGKQIMQGLAKAMFDTKAASFEMAQQVIEDALLLREIASNEGKATPGMEGLLQHMDVRRQSGFTAPEAASFVGAISNTLGTVSKDTFPDAERQDLQIRGAKLASMKGGDASTIKARGEMIGTLAGVVRGPGGAKPTAKNVVAEAHRVDAILARGNKEQGVMTDQFRKVMTSMMDPTGELKGLVTDPKEAAALTTIASNFGEDMFDSIKMVTREVEATWKQSKKKGMVGTQGEYLKKAGVKDADSPVVKMQKIFDQLDKDMKPGEKVDNEATVQSHLQKHGFMNSKANVKLQGFYLQHRRGMFGEIMGEARKPVDQEAPERDFQQFKADPLTGGMLLAKQEKAHAMFARGTKVAPLAVGVERAKAQLAKDDSFFGGIRSGLGTAVTLGQMSGADLRANAIAGSSAIRQTKGSDPLYDIAHSRILQTTLTPQVFDVIRHLSGTNEAAANEANKIRQQQLDEQKKANELAAKQLAPGIPPARPARPAPQGNALVP
jgi:hypothetical protein